MILKKLYYLIKNKNFIAFIILLSFLIDLYHYTIYFIFIIKITFKYYHKLLNYFFYILLIFRLKFFGAILFKNYFFKYWVKISVLAVNVCLLKYF